MRRLLAEDKHEVVGVVRRPPTSGWPYTQAQWVQADLAHPSSLVALNAAMTGAQAVVHLAWGFQPSHDVGYLRSLGVEGTRRVLTAAVTQGVDHLVHMSSVGAYSPKTDDRPVDESWPTGGVPSSPYRSHKVAAERLLDGYEGGGGRLPIARMRPGIIGQRDAGSALLRYGVPALVPASVLRALPVLPMDRRLLVPVVHADDVADAIVRVLESGETGPFNLAAQSPADASTIAAALGARNVHVPAPVLRAAASATWRLRLQAVDPGWLDLGFSVPLLDTSRAQRKLG